MTGRRESDNADLLARVGQGDPSAVAQLLGRYRDRLRRMIAVRMDDRLSARVDPSDVVQETLVAASEQLSDYLRQCPLPFYPWLRQLAANRLADLHRKHVAAGKRSLKSENPPGISDVSAAKLADRFAASQTGPLSRLIRREARARVREALARLAERDREILVLRHLEELSFADSAAVLGISEAAAKQRHVRALRRIHRLLHDHASGASS